MRLSIRARRLLAALVATLFVGSVAASGVSAYRLNPTYYGYAKQTTNYRCVVSSAVTTRYWVYQQTVPSDAGTMEKSFEDYINTNHKDRLATTYQNGTNPLYSDKGHDPRGWAWVLFKNTPAGYYFQDYRYNSLAKADLELVWTLYYDRHPQGVVAGSYTKTTPTPHGVSHAIDVYDFQTNVEPGSSYPPLEIQGFWVLDPWYGSGNGYIKLGGSYPITGYAPQSYVAINEWGNSILRQIVPNDFDIPTTPGHTENSDYYKGYWLLVLRRGNAVYPGDNPVNDPTAYGDFTPGTTLAVAREANPDPSTLHAPAPVSATPDAAIAEALLAYGSSFSTSKQDDLDGTTTGTSVHVDSLDPAMPSYELVDLNQNGKTVAVAKINDVGGKFQLGQIRWVNASYHAFDAQSQRSIVSAAGLNGSSRLVWKLSDASSSPFEPVIDINGPSGHKFVGPGGIFSSLD